MKEKFLSACPTAKGSEYHESEGTKWQIAVNLTAFAGGKEWSTRLIAELAGRKTRSRSTLLPFKAKIQADLRKYVSIFHT